MNSMASTASTVPSHLRADNYPALNPAMLFIALANHLRDHCIQRYFVADPIVRRVLPLLGLEDFFD